MKTLNDLPNVTGKTIFVRTDFNVPIVGGKVGDGFRLQKSFQTIDALLARGARLILASHIESGSDTLVPVADYLKKKYQIAFISDYFPTASPDIKNALENGSIVLLENLRKYPEEKVNDDDFAKHLAGFADFYVNEAFPSSHRPHASIVGIPKYIPGFAGYTFCNEVEQLSSALVPKHPALAVIGGVKFSTKEPILKKLLDIYDHVFVGGALANDFMKEKGMPMEKSLVSDADPKALDPLLQNPKLLLPCDEVIAAPGATVSESHVEMLDGKPPYEAVFDEGPETLAILSKFVAEATTILWNGPLGNYENGFSEGTKALAQMISDSHAFSIVGGGDTITSIAELNISDKFSFISTGGGAMLEFLANETLPGIEALNKSL
jgi:phosphoglycerate kinase